MSDHNGGRTVFKIAKNGDRFSEFVKPALLVVTYPQRQGVPPCDNLSITYVPYRYVDARAHPFTRLTLSDGRVFAEGEIIEFLIQDDVVTNALGGTYFEFMLSKSFLSVAQDHPKGHTYVSGADRASLADVVWATLQATCLGMRMEHPKHVQIVSQDQLPRLRLPLPPSSPPLPIRGLHPPASTTAIHPSPSTPPTSTILHDLSLLDAPGLVVQTGERYVKSVGRGMVTGPRIVISQSDALCLKDGEGVTLDRWGNVVVKGIDEEEWEEVTLDSESAGTVVTWLCLQMTLTGSRSFRSTKKKITWLAVAEEGGYPAGFGRLAPWGIMFIRDVLQGQGNETVTRAFADRDVVDLKEGDVALFARKGYYRVDRAYGDGNERMVFWQIPNGLSKWAAKKMRKPCWY
ncbi:hypothetical protein GE09DRAFT_1289382 [Coniochaeta sp. 2T2.1]|nr:hypothetical protein GE09DRAFT_1289382 [Coniochaeta sp. 2T2.1]